MIPSYWSQDSAAVAQRLGSGPGGLAATEADRRLREFGSGSLQPQRSLSRLAVLWRQVKSPLLLLLVFAALVSASTGAWSDAAIVLAIVLATVGFGYSREYQAETAAAALRARVRTNARVLRDGQPILVPREQVVPGDVIILSAGSLVPADGLILQSKDFFVGEALLTGESFPVEKACGQVATAAPLAARTNCVFLGTNVRSGTAQCLVVSTGSQTEFGAIAARLARRAPETDVLVVFAAHMLRGRPPIETLLFAVALAVGLSPELLPAILTINLARGAQMMARRGVLVRHLNAIENLGSMNVLCTDKTGTLTEGVVRLEGSYDADGVSSRDVLERAACNAALETGLANPLDDAILEALRPNLGQTRKLAEIPFDFVRKRVSVVVERPDGVQLIAKGAFATVLAVCDRIGSGAPLDAERRTQVEQRYRDWSGKGIRVIAVAARSIDARPSYGRQDEVNLSFLGFLTFLDRPKDGAKQALADLAQLGVSVRLITGDNRLVAEHVAGLVGMRTDRTLTGAELARLDDAALWQVVERTDVFAEVDPNQKERILLALKKNGHVVGFLGDGVNDAPAMHVADTSLSVQQAVDVAKEAADFVLLEPDLDVIRGGIEEGRRTFANTLKYILTTTSANLGNMISMAVASLFLPFLPLLASQILLNNLLSDVPAVGIAEDSVDPEMVERPPRWDIRFIGRFMVEFGLISSVFDFVTFGLLLWMFHAGVTMFRTGWFVESLLTELAVALIVRTRRPFYRSRPGRLLLWSTAAMAAVAFAIPYLPGMGWFGLVPLPGSLMLSLVAVVCLYVSATELGKRVFYRTRRSAGV
jgi:Mg2+-importing ATPase